MPTTYIFMAVTALISLVAFSNENLMRSLMMNPWLITTKKQYYRFLTSGFIHRDMTHLFFNMFSFYFFGTIVERDFHFIFNDQGTLYFIILYCVAIIVSDLPTFFKQRNNPGYNSLGASGGVSAVIFVSIVLRPLETIYVYFLPIPGFILGLLYIGYSWYQGKQSKDSVNHDAHLYGALFGLVFCVVMYPACITNFIAQIKEWKIF